MQRYFGILLFNRTLIRSRHCTSYKKYFNRNHIYIYHVRSQQTFRNLHSSSFCCSKESSKVEEQIKQLKEELVEKRKEKALAEQALNTSLEKSTAAVPVPKRSLGKRIVDEIIHYYHGFKLLFIDIKVSAKYIYKILNGGTLTRREHKQLIRTISDIFRLVPFTIIIAVPFLEFALPVLLKLFPGMLPSTFQSSSDRDAKFKAQLKVKIEMAKFLQDTLQHISLAAKGEAHSNKAKEFAEFFEKIRSSGDQASNTELIKYSKLFEDELTLDSLSRPQLIALCRLLELQPIGTTNFLRFQLRMRLRTLKADDRMIEKEGVENLSIEELQAACRSRGMRALGLPESRLRSQLQQWLELSLNNSIPPSLLLLSRALFLPENLPAPDQLKATLSSLPDTAATKAKYRIGEAEGKVDNKTKLDIIKKEELAIKKEAEELEQDLLKKEKDLLLEEKALDISETESKELSKEDIQNLEDALEQLSDEKKQLLIEKEEIEELKEEMAEYKEDIEELKGIEGHEKLHESKAALRLTKKVDKMINKMDKLLSDLGKERDHLQEEIHHKEKEGVEVVKERDHMVNINELASAIKKIQKVSDDTKLQRIVDVLEKMDVDHDGSVEVDHVLKVIELLGKENVKVSSKQVEEIIELLMKEDTLETEEKLQKQKQSLQDCTVEDKSKEVETK